MPEYTAGGLRIHYEDRGNPQGPAVVMLPSLGGNHLTWGGVAAGLGQRYRLVLPDPRDAGKSGHATRPYAIAEMASDIAGLMGHLGIAPAYVAGLSMGGAIAQELALERPELVRRLVLIATYDSGDPRGTAIFRHLAHLRRILSREDYHRTLLPWLFTHEEFHHGIDPEEVVRRLTQDPFFQPPDAYERQMEATIAFSSTDRLHRIACPTYLVFGDEDLFTPLRFARSLHAGIAGSRLAVLHGAGHGLVWTRGREVAALIDSFLQEDRRPAGKETP